MRQVRVLLAEDDADHIKLMRRALEAQDGRVQIVTASNRAGALRAVKAGDFDCLVIDFKLGPDMAPEVIEDVRRIRPDLPVIVVSASEDQRVVIESLRTGVADFVPKEVAVHGDALARCVHGAILKSRQAEAERRLASRRLRVLHRQAETDPLTGLRNRRSAARVLSGTARRSDRRLTTACVMIDLDHFKDVNDRWGHHAGDAVLRTVSEVLSSCAGPSDVVARWGGEEFLVIRSCDSLTDAWTWADRARRAIAERSIDVGLEGTIQVTASVGLAVFPTTQLCEHSVTIADEALYLAKDLGRNRACTEAMVRAMGCANDVESSRSIPPHGRGAELLRRYENLLGPVQRDHLGPHSERVARYCLAVAGMMELTEPERATLEDAALHHDIGKIGVPEHLLAKPMRLTSDEKRLVDEHARFGSELLRAAGAPAPVAAVVAAHHRRHDDRGDDGPPLDPTAERLAKIVAAADALDAMLSTRPFAIAREPAEALAELRRERGLQFDPRVVDCLHSAGAILQRAAA